MSTRVRVFSASHLNDAGVPGCFLLYSGKGVVLVYLMGHGVKKRAGTCHMLPKQRGELSCADLGGVMRVADRGRMR